VIASTPVARWTWGRDDDSVDALSAGLRDLLTAYAALAAHRLAIGEQRVVLTVGEMGTPKNSLFQGEFTVPGASGVAEATEELARKVRAALLPGEIGSAEAYTVCTGLLAGEAEEVRQEGLFRLATSAFADFVSTDLVTSSDAWLPYDLKGRPQPTVHAANAPRLAGALHGLAEALDSETDPDDPTYFGKPTATGVDNWLDDDGTPSDVWGSFEIPQRSRVFRHAPGFASAGYARSADGPVRYVPVAGEHGVLGYLWASDPAGAASFEPRDDAGEDGYRAGLRWLERLRSAYDRGLSPSQALTELSGLAPGESPGTLDLTTLRERAGTT
jgi:hypothetical protein